VEKKRKSNPRAGTPGTGPGKQDKNAPGTGPGANLFYLTDSQTALKLPDREQS